MDYIVLKQDDVKAQFVDNFKASMQRSSIPRNIDERLLDINAAMRNATQECIPLVIQHKQRPWISSSTLTLIEERNAYRRSNDTNGEKLVSKRMK